MVNIDNVYQKVLALANKEQRGYITPQEFNLLAHKAQLDIFNNYFHDIKTSYYKPKNMTEGMDEGEMTHEKMSIFRRRITGITKLNHESDSGFSNLGNPTSVDGGTTVDSDGLINLREYKITVDIPSDAMLYKIAAAYLLTNGYTQSSTTGDAGIVWKTKLTKVNNTEIKPVDRKRLLDMNMHPLTRPTASRPVYIHCYNNVEKIQYLELHPQAKYNYNLSNLDGSDAAHWVLEVGDKGIQGEGVGEGTQDNGDGGAVQVGGGSEVTMPGATVAIDYWKTPNIPAWGYVVVNEKPLYNSSPTATTHFDLHVSEEENLVIRILQLAGVVIDKPQLYQMAAADKQQSKQEQND